VHVVLDVASFLRAFFFNFALAGTIEQLREDVPEGPAKASASFGICIDVVEVREVKA
jgi:hypothetical protein